MKACYGIAERQCSSKTIKALEFYLLLGFLTLICLRAGLTSDRRREARQSSAYKLKMRVT